MDRINRILKDPAYQDYVAKNEAAEVDRIFCGHDLTHFLDVCRIAWILNLERGLGLDKDEVYAAGLLHDTGRWQEYATGIDHAQASVNLAAPILDRCGYTPEETERILEAIGAHRKRDHASPLAQILFEADKKSRMCLYCDARGQCKKFQNGETFFFSY